jgi:hypothetical protein
VNTLSTDLDDDAAQPYFIWDVPVTLGELKRLLRDPDQSVRALWIARVMREARYEDVWKLVSLEDVLTWFPRAQRHLGRSRRFWEFLLGEWRRRGLVAEPA